MKQLLPVILVIASGGLGAETASQDHTRPADHPEADAKRPLAEAARTGCADWNTKRFFESAVPESVAACLSAGAEAAARDDGFLGWTPLHTAVIYSENLAVIQALIGAGADPKWRDNHGGTPLHWASAMTGNVAVIQALIAAGADPNVRDNVDRTPLHSAANDNGNVAVVQALIAAGADPNARQKDGRTPLHDAAMNNRNEAVIEALIAAGADPKARDGDVGSTPLHRAAAFNGNEAVIEALIAAGADPEARNNRDRTVLHYAASNANEVVTQVLITAGADPDARQKDGGTPLHTAASDNRNEAVARTLIAANADPDARNNYGWTPLHMVGYARSADILLAAGAEVGTRRDRSGETPLHGAAWFVREVEVIHTLIAHGAEIDALDRRGNTPLHTAARSAAEGIASGGAAIVALLDAGADPTRRNGRGETPWDLAKDNEEFRQSDAYQRLDEARINVPSGP